MSLLITCNLTNKLTVGKLMLVEWECIKALMHFEKTELLYNINVVNILERTDRFPMSGWGACVRHREGVVTPNQTRLGISPRDLCPTFRYTRIDCLEGVTHMLRPNCEIVHCLKWTNT